MDYVYTLDSKFNEKSELGNKGGNLVVMTELGLPVPPGFIVTIGAFKQWQETGLLPEEAINEALATLEKKMGRNLGAGLEVSVRSSAPVSMPGMMDTVLNIGNMDALISSIKRIFESWNSPGDRVPPFE